MPKKTALIIGGTSGIGYGIAEQLLSRGVTTFIIGRRTIENKTENHTDLIFIQADLTLPHSIDHIEKKLGETHLDYVVFSAATETPLKRFPEITESEYDYAFTLNVKIPFLLTKALLKNFNPHARLLFLTSRLSSSPEVGSLIYCMTKSAIEIFSAGLNKELNQSVFSSSIIPGIVDTEMQKRLREADPRTFPNTFIYNEMRSKLQGISMASEFIVSHLCDTDNVTYAAQRVTMLNNRYNLAVSKL